MTTELERWEKRMLDGFRNYDLPDHMWGGIHRYVMAGVPTGDFLRAVLSSDLCGAVNHADERNAARLVAWVKFLFNECPAGCFGSTQAYVAWVERGGLNALAA